MSRALRWTLLVVAPVLAIPAGGAAFLRFARPVSRPASTESVERTPERLARGAYLMEHLLPCIGCHSERDAGRYGMPVRPGAALAGGEVMDRTLGLPGVFEPPNITPDVETGIGGWTDGELVRAIREGIHQSGRALFPLMPYGAMRALSDEDARAVVVYLRAQRPVRRATRPPEVDFPVSLLMRAEPAPVETPVPGPDRRDTVAYGRYLVEIAGCVLCHTPAERGRPVPGQEFSGGRELFITHPEGRARSVSANITTDPETGYFGFATREDWIARVRSFAALRAEPPAVERGRNTMMPWLEYAGLSDEDLGAIHDFMKTVRPIRKVVERFPDARGVTAR